jgi:hypothetical protein
MGDSVLRCDCGERLSLCWYEVGCCYCGERRYLSCDVCGNLYDGCTCDASGNPNMTVFDEWIG